jgi:hypothetical protein
MPGARSTRGPACSVESTRVSHHGHAGETRHSLRDGFNGFLRALPSDRAFLPLSPAQCGTHCHELDASVGASEPHDFAVRRLAVRPRRHRRATTLPRPPHPKPYVRDDRETPLNRERDGAR